MPTKINPGDDVSWGLMMKELLGNERWFRGPAFLWENKSLWPTNPVSIASNSDEDPEVRARGQTNHITQMKKKRPLDLMMLHNHVQVQERLKSSSMCRNQPSCQWLRPSKMYAMENLTSVDWRTSVHLAWCTNWNHSLTEMERLELVVGFRIRHWNTNQNTNCCYLPSNIMIMNLNLYSAKTTEEYSKALYIN